VGAVFNRDLLSRIKICNRGWKPLPPGINFNLKIIIGSDKVSYEVSGVSEGDRDNEYIHVIGGP
jgi:hypothetical protein